MQRRERKAAAKEPRHCEECEKEFKPNAEGLTISHGEYLSSGLKWFCDEVCTEKYTNEKGW